MGCVTDTNSIDLSVTGGQLSAALNVDPVAQNLLTVSSAGVLVGLNGGWLPMGATLAFSSASSPTFIATTSLDLTGVVPVGSKVSLVQSATILYFIVTAISSTTITLYGGTSYTLANTTITTPLFSYMNTPFGFPRSPALWRITYTSGLSHLQSIPTANTWYNPSSQSITVPTGVWKVSYGVLGRCNVGSSGTTVNLLVTLSTSSSSETDGSLTSSFYGIYGSNPSEVSNWLSNSDLQTFASNTPMYLNFLTQTNSVSDIGSDSLGGPTTTKIVAECAYL